MKKYLITGGTGLIGLALIKQLEQETAFITVLTRDIEKANKMVLTLGLDPDITFIDELTLEHIENQDTVINLAGEPIAEKRWTKKRKVLICQSRWQLTEQLVDLIQQAKNPPSLFISGSAIGIYGRQTDITIDETFVDFHHEFTHLVCDKWEGIANQAKSQKTRIALLRTGIVLAHNGGALNKMLLPFKLGLGGKTATGEQYMSWIHIEDAVSGILFIDKNHQLSGPINLTATPVTNKEFTETLAKTLRRTNVMTLPATLLKIILGEMSDLLVYGQNVVPSKLIENGFKFKYPSVSLALANLLTEE
ncbi:TIGR01777 family oxidoreductase [Thalassotalea piscium]